MYIFPKKYFYILCYFLIVSGYSQDWRQQAFQEGSNYYEIVENRRKELKMSQEKLAEIVGKKRPYISRLENGTDVRISNLLLVAEALDLSLQLTPR